MTLVTDIPLSKRVAYVGIDNRAAGSTAAYLIDLVGGPAGTILLALSRSFSGARRSANRLPGHHAELFRRRVHWSEATDTDGLDAIVRESTLEPCVARPGITRGLLHRRRKQAILEAFDAAGRTARSSSGMTWTGTTCPCIQNERMTAVLHHDLRSRHAARLSHHHAGKGGIEGQVESDPSQIIVVTP